MGLKRFIAKGLRNIFQPPALTNTIIKKKSKICSGSQVNNCVIDKYSYIGHNCFLLNASVGSFCSIADNCRIGGASHTINYVSSSPVFNRGKNCMHMHFAEFDNNKDLKIDIGADVWIGANAIIKSGITIGAGAVIGAGSVVTHNVPPYEIWAGNPAKKIKDRFNENIKNELLSLRWWEYDDDKIKRYSMYFNDPELFIESIKKVNQL